MRVNIVNSRLEVIGSVDIRSFEYTDIDCIYIPYKAEGEWCDLRLERIKAAVPSVWVRSDTPMELIERLPGFKTAASAPTAPAPATEG
jgi:hypothetical protein